MGVELDPGPNLLLTKLVKDFQSGTLDEQGMKELLLTLTYEQSKSLYSYVLNTLDPFSPDETLVDLLDWLDPNETYFN